jgi:hypothetical protein
VSLSCCLLASCATPSADKPDVTIAPAPCDPVLQVEPPKIPDVPDGAGIVKPPLGSQAAAATGLYLGWVSELHDTATELLRRATIAKAYCDGR